MPSTSKPRDLSGPATTAVPCDCLNHCGDDPWLCDGRASPCQHYLDARQHEADAREQDTLQRRLAYSAARSDIECELLCVAHERRPDGGYTSWFDIGQMADPGQSQPDEHQHLVDAVRYLRLSGLIEDHPTRAGVIRVRDLLQES